VYTLDKNGGLLEVQDAMVRKIVNELNQFDNLYYEICNEPYFGGVTLDWQHHIAETILATERHLAKQHLISRNVANGSAKVENAHPLISILNFHYAAPPNTVPMNYTLNKVIGDNETGFRGTNDLPYRSEAWAFILSGGGLYNNLDYSFVAGHENGTFVYPATQPGGGNPQFREQLRALRDFMSHLDFIHMQPANDVIRSGPKPGEAVYALGKLGKEYGIYIGLAPLKKGETHDLSPRTLALELAIPNGEYTAEWLDPVRGRSFPKEKVTARGGSVVLNSPEYSEDIALSLHKH